MDSNPYHSSQPVDGDRPFRATRLILTLLLIVYFSSYVALSRQGFAKADELELSGQLWFFVPDDGEHWQVLHWTCGIVYLPLILVDSALGTGRSPGHCWIELSYRSR